MRNDNNKLCNLLKAKDPLIYTVTYEENAFIDKLYEVLRTRIIGGIKPADIYEYSIASGLRLVKKDGSGQYIAEKALPGIKSPHEVMKIIYKIQCGEPCENLMISRGAIFVFKDFYQLFKDITIVRMLRDMKENYKSDIYCPIVVTGPTLELPASVSKLFSVYEFPLLTYEEIFTMLDPLLGCVGLPIEKIEAIAHACVGLTEREILKAVLHSLAKHNKGTAEPRDIYDEKVVIMKSSGLLDFLIPSHGLDDLGGCEKFKNWIKKLKVILNNEAKEFGVPKPKGALLVGVPGTSKSMSAEIIADYLAIPLVSLNMSKIMGTLVGESEKNIAGALNIVKTVSPCVFLIDEVEKLLGGFRSSNSCDGGALARVMAHILQFLQNNDKDVITIMTSNDISQLPPELTRSGRLDGIWFFDFPDKSERLQILEIYLKKYNLECDETVLNVLLEKTENYTGAELEQIVKNLKTEIYVRQIQEEGYMLENRIQLEDVQASLNSVIPISKTSWENLIMFRKEASNKYLNASGSREDAQKCKRKSIMKPVTLASKS